MSGILNAIETSAQGLSIQRAKMNTVAKNMANAETVEGPDGKPYRRERVIVSAKKERPSFGSHLSRAQNKLTRTHEGHRSGIIASASRSEGGVRAEFEQIEDPESNYRLVYDPQHPNADEEGFVKMPDIEVVTEMVDMMAASRAYEANTSVISTAKNMAKDALEI